MIKKQNAKEEGKDKCGEKKEGLKVQDGPGKESASGGVSEQMQLMHWGEC